MLSLRRHGDVRHAARRHGQDRDGDGHRAERRVGGNYTLASSTATTTANITAVPLTPTVTALNKVYDGTTAATATCLLTGVVGTDVVTCAGTATFDTASVGTGKTVTVTGITLSGAAAGNYTLATRRRRRRRISPR